MSLVLRIAAIAIFGSLLSAPVAAAQSDGVAYALHGSDSYQIAGRHAVKTYNGREMLKRLVRKGSRHFSVSVVYAMSDRPGGALRHISFVRENSGTTAGHGIRDPDQLSILSQPLPYEIDARQMQAIAALRDHFPFDFPMSGGLVSGYLAPASISRPNTVGISFAAKGPMRGSLPGTPDVTVSGTLTLSGTAYYSPYDGRLVAIDDAIEFNGSLAGSDRFIPVHVSYVRKIHALSPIARIGKAR
jgi:hypothetical protein